MRWFVLIACLIGTPCTAYVSGEGHEYASHCTEDGLVLQTAGSVTRILENGAKTQHISEQETIYLGKSCDAYTKTFGYGQWEWANGGLLVKFPRHEFGFPRQEIYCPEGGPQPFDEILQCSMR